MSAPKDAGHIIGPARLTIELFIQLQLALRIEIHRFHHGLGRRAPTNRCCGLLLAVIDVVLGLSNDRVPLITDRLLQALPLIA